MDKLATPSVITAIADPEFEGMVSSLLFGQGWNVIARTLDMSSLETELNKKNQDNLILIYSSDLPGLALERLQEISRMGVTTFGFTDAAGSAQGFPGLSIRPSSSAELLSYIRANIRSARLRSPLLQPMPNLKTKIIGIGSAEHSTGNTVLAINLAQESALLGLKTLLIDANFQAPAIATLLDLRKVSLEEKWRDVSDKLSLSEVTQQKVGDFGNWAIAATSVFDAVYIDLGSLANFSSDLTDRRWASQIKIWISNLANQLIVTSTAELLQQKRLKDFMHEISQITVIPKLSIAMLALSDLKRRGDLDLSNSPFNARIWNIPYDARACALAEKERTTFAQVCPRSSLRKAILNITTQITD